MIIRNALLKILYGSRSSSESYIKYLRKKGISIGNGTVFYEPTTNIIDIQNPKLLILGSNVRITAGVKILTHDYSWSVLTGVYGECLGGVMPTYIGNNVFLGIDSIITAGVTIGDNVIIGAGSIVTKDVESNSVYGGVPAKKIMNLEEFYKKKRDDVKNNIEKINQIIGSDCKLKEQYLREYAFYCPEISSDREKLMKDTGYYEKAKEFYHSN